MERPQHIVHEPPRENARFELAGIIGMNVETMRKELNMNEREIGDAAGVSRQVISAIVNRKANTTASNLEKIAHALGVEPWMLLYPDGVSAARDLKAKID